MNKEVKKTKKRPVVGITLGDINGIGPEVIIKALEGNKILNQVTPVIYGSSKVLSYYRKSLNRNNFNFTQIKGIDAINHRKVNVLNCWDEMVELKPGEMNEEGGKYAFISLERCTQDLKDGKIDAMVTAPINKHNIQSESFQFAGHTEYLANACDKKEHLMLLVSEAFRVGVVTGHVPLKDVPQAITAEKLEAKLNMMVKTVKNDFGVAKPKIAVLGLNPHAGEDGLLGTEEQEIIKPLIEKVKNKGQVIMGPFPADGFFGSGQHLKFDGILAMYHDQGLIPFKALAFSNGVNYTAGLPIVRTSPDHGTAYSIAGKGEADESSMRSAIFMAIDIASQRMENS